jgi:hypothetical protein
MKEFRRMNVMSGNLRVHGRSRPRRVARPPEGTAIERKQLEPAATDDESGEAVGGGATSSVTTATTREAHAEAAGEKPEAVRATKKSEDKKEKKKEQIEEQKKEEKKARSDEPQSAWDKKAELGGGEELPEDAAKFVAAVQKKIDLVELAVFVLRRGDERLTQRQLEQLLEMKYGKNSRGGESAAKQYVIDIPSAVAARARERE